MVTRAHGTCRTSGKKRVESREIITPDFFKSLKLLPVNLSATTEPEKAVFFDWPGCLAKFSDADAIRLATHPKRQYKVETVQWFHKYEHLGLYRGQITFAMRDATGKVVGVNRWFEDEGKWKFLKSPTLFVVGDPAVARELHIHESINDLVAMVDRTGWHLDSAKLFFCTWGASGAKLGKDRIPSGINKIYVWEQRDQPDPKTGIPPNEGWQARVANAAARPVHLVRIPEAYKDLNEWTIAGATAEQITFPLDFAKLYRSANEKPEPPKPDYKDLPKNFPPAEQRPCYRVYDSPVTINGRKFKAGVYSHEVATSGEGKYPQDTFICAVLRVVAKTATARDRDFGRLLEYYSSNGIKRTWSMPMELLAGDGSPVLSQLLRDGLEINHPAKKKVLDYISKADPAEFYRCATRTGWHSPTTFVLTEEIITAENGEPKDKVWFQSSSKTADYTKNGSLENWKLGVAAKASGNPYLLFAIAFGLSGPVMMPLNLRGLGVHIHGDSTTGKTSVSEAGASCWGHGHDFLQTWNLTANGMETVAVEHTDTLLTLDEIKEIEARDLDRVAYSAVNGQGKIRSDRSGQARSPHLWRVALFSTGEYSIGARLAEANINIKTGQELRLVDLPVVDEAYGIFNNLHNARDGAEFATSLRTAASQNCGHAGPAMVKAILGYQVSLLREQHSKILGCFSTTNAQQARVAEMFAAVALAGEIAARAEIVPWTAATADDYSDSDSVNAAVSLFNRWKENRSVTPTSFSNEHSSILVAVSDFIERHSESRFSDVNATPHVTKMGHSIEPPIVRDRAGYWDDSSGSRIYLFTNSGLREATKAYDFRRVIKALDDAKAFTKKGTDKTSVLTRIPNGGIMRLYYIDPAQLQTL